MEEKKELNQTEATTTVFTEQANQQNPMNAPQTSPMQAAPVQTPPVQTPPVQTPPVQTPPVQTPPVQPFPVQPSPVQAPVNQGPRFCAKCGKLLMADQQFCPGCGSKVAQTAKKKSGAKKVLPILLGGIIVVVVAVILVSRLGGGKTADMKAVYDSLDSPGLYVTLSSDEKSISIDTNPFDIEDYYDEDSWTLVEDVNERLGLPDSILDEMEQTSALDGRISREYDGISVSWKYHPDNGLEVIYSLVE